jgi:hypothetical protein
MGLEEDDPATAKNNNNEATVLRQDLYYFWSLIDFQCVFRRMQCVYVRSYLGLSVALSVSPHITKFFKFMSNLR